MLRSYHNSGQLLGQGWRFFFHFFLKLFQNCPKIVHRQPNAFRATYGSVSQNGLAHFLDNFGVSKFFNFFQNSF
jgi:hypothetical protein